MNDQGDDWISLDSQRIVVVSVSAAISEDQAGVLGTLYYDDVGHSLLCDARSMLQFLIGLSAWHIQSGMSSWIPGAFQIREQLKFASLSLDSASLESSTATPTIIDLFPLPNKAIG